MCSRHLTLVGTVLDASHVCDKLVDVSATSRWLLAPAGAPPGAAALVRCYTLGVSLYATSYPVEVGECWSGASLRLVPACGWCVALLPALLLAFRTPQPYLFLLWSV
jgi:hypothetical protein